MFGPTDGKVRHGDLLRRQEQSDAMKEFTGRSKSFQEALKKTNFENKEELNAICKLAYLIGQFKLPPECLELLQNRLEGMNSLGWHSQHLLLQGITGVLAPSMNTDSRFNKMKSRFGKVFRKEDDQYPTEKDF